MVGNVIGGVFSAAGQAGEEEGGEQAMQRFAGEGDEGSRV